MSELGAARHTVHGVNQSKQASELAAGMVESTFRAYQLALSALKHSSTINTVLPAVERVHLRVRLGGPGICVLATIIYLHSQALQSVIDPVFSYGIATTRDVEVQFPLP